MRVSRFWPVAGLLAASLLGSAACDRREAPRAGDSATIGQEPTPVEDLQPGDTALTTMAAPVLAVHGSDAGTAILVGPDDRQLQLREGTRVTLTSRGGEPQEVTLGSAPSATCPTAVPRRVDGQDLGGWSIGVFGAGVVPLGVDSAASLSRTDSTQLARVVTRLASALPNDTAGRFTGRQFQVNALWAFVVNPGERVVVAMLRRQIDQEASPLEERTFLVAESRGGSTDADWRTAYSERSHGPGETVEAREFLGAVRIGSRPTIVLSRDFGDGVAYSFVERRADGSWFNRWTSSRGRC